MPTGRRKRATAATARGTNRWPSSPSASQKESFGLFQFNDKRRGRFTAERVALLEDLVDHVAIALAKLRADEALRFSEERYRSLFENMLEGYAYCEMIVENGEFRDFVYLDVNPAFEHLTGLAGVVGKRVTDVIPGIRESDPELFELYGRVAFSGRPERVEIYVEAMKIWFSVSVYGAGRGFFVAVFDNVTERRKLEDQLRQSQKMEAVGRLAGGVAHDFNNLLTVINGYSELLLRQVGENSTLRKEVEEIRKAGDRAAMLTRQLLAFSRRQVLQPKVLDLNATVSGMATMLRRLIGEDIDLRILPGEGLGRVKADPGQVEQIILNLVVNARDAMPGGGKLSIETSNTLLDGTFSSKHPYTVAGPHVLLAVSDTGVGMSEDTQAHLFEPFFTTKEKGKGTGLGLSTVYGIVKQSQGYIHVYSELGKGTTVKIYLPRVEGEDETVSPVPAPARARHGNGARGGGQRPGPRFRHPRPLREGVPGALRLRRVRSASSLRGERGSGGSSHHRRRDAQDGGARTGVPRRDREARGPRPLRVRIHGRRHQPPRDPGSGAGIPPEAVHHRCALEESAGGPRSVV